MSAAPVLRPTGPAKVPPLESGDRLTRAEFERRYDAMPNLKKAELLEGEVYMGSPVRLSQHGEPHGGIITWIGLYRAFTPGVRHAAGASVRLDMENEPQPDGTLFVEPSHGGHVKINTDDYIEGSPELAAEISASTFSIDFHKKWRVYQRNQIQEYVIWRVYENAIDWFALREEKFEPLPLGDDGIYRSVVFPGLWLDPAAMVRMDLAKVLEVLQRGLASPEHAAFVAKLESQVRALGPTA